MPITTTVPVYAGDAPNLTDSEAKFNQDVQDILDYMSGLAPSLNSFSSQLNTVSQDVADIETQAAAARDTAQIHANLAASFSAATVYSSSESYKFPDVVRSPDDGQAYCCLSQVAISGENPVNSLSGNWSKPLGPMAGINVTQEIDCAGKSSVVWDCSLADTFTCTNFDTDCTVTITNLRVGAAITGYLLGNKTGVTITVPDGPLYNWVNGITYEPTENTVQLIYKKISAAGTHICSCVDAMRP